MSLDSIHAAFRDIPDFPKPGIVFKDISPVLLDGRLFSELIDLLAAPYVGQQVDAIAAVEARGFVFGSALALRLGCGVIMVRKAGKLPWQTQQATYDLEYGTSTLEVHVDAAPRGERVVVVDDVLATGGTAVAACGLLRDIGATIVGVSFVMELGFLGGRARLADYPVHSLIELD